MQTFFPGHIRWLKISFISYFIIRTVYREIIFGKQKKKKDKSEAKYKLDF